MLFTVGSQQCRGTHWQCYGPLYLVGVAIPLVMADLTRHVLQDSDIWSGPSSSMYKPHCGHSERRLGGITCLSVTGWLFTIVFTYAGFACMITGEMTCQTCCMARCCCMDNQVLLG
ncbi:hypothetical protein ABBQ38_014433 [Trebouxia sp. C0009 RCD-2024]